MKLIAKNTQISKLIKNEFFLILLIYFAAVVAVNPVGEFPVNDDWIFFRQVEAFTKGIFKISSIIDPSFILQGLMGYIWSILFGLSFTSLRLLTILVTVLSLYGVYKTLLVQEISKKTRVLVLFLFIFNPIVFISSFTFMTDNYFLLFFVWSIYFYLKFFKSQSYIDLLLGTAFVGFSILVRQLGILIIAVFYIVCVLKKFKIPKPHVPLLLVLVSVLVLLIWPRYNTDFLKNFVNKEHIFSALSRPFYSLPYFAFFLLPFFLKVKKRKFLPLILISTFFIFLQIFRLDVFPIGNVLYIEELYSKFFYKINLSLFDSIIFTSIIALVISFGIADFIFSIKLTSLNIPQAFLFLAGIIMLFVLVIASDYYDRYLLPSFYGFLIFGAQLNSNFNFPKSTYFSLLLIFILSLFLQWEHFSHTRIRWAQAQRISITTGLNTSIYVDGVWDRFNNAKKSSDYAGLGDRVSVANYKCYVQKYTEETDNPFFLVSKNLEEILENITDNPRIFKSKKPEIRSVKNNLNELIYNEEYFSPLYTMIGKRAFVGSWCENEQ